MGLFDELAGRSFSTSPTGERLFHLNGPWSRPYVIPDLATEERLRRKVRMLAKVIVLGPLAILLGFLLFLLVIVVLAANSPRSHSPSHEDVTRAINPAQETIVHKDPNLNIEIPESSPDRDAGGSALFVLVPLGLVLAAGVLLPKLLFGKDLRQLRRLPTRISFTDFYRPYEEQQLCISDPWSLDVWERDTSPNFRLDAQALAAGDRFGDFHLAALPLRALVPEPGDCISVVSQNH